MRLGGDLVKFNKEFALAAAAATPLLGEWGVKDVYLNAVEGKVGAAIRLAQNSPLQIVMASALDLDSTLQKSAGTGSAGQGASQMAHS